MLKKKILRDVWNYKIQFISIFLMAFIGVFIFTGLTGEVNSFETTIDDFYETTNLADGWIYSDYLVDDFLKQVYLLGPTTQMERQLIVDSQAKLDNHPDIILHFVENNTISKFYVTEGEKLDINDSEGVWLDKNFAEANSLKIGDTISFESNGVEIKKVIRGLGYSPEYVYDVPVSSTVPDHKENGFAYLSHKAFPSHNIPYNVLNIKFDGSPETYSKLLDYRLNGYYSSFLSKSNHYSANVVSDSLSQQKALSSIFPLVFIIISILMLSTTMKRIITQQRTQLGILKANGFSNKSIIIPYIISGLSVVTLAAVSGVISGPIIFHSISYNSINIYFNIPFWHFIGYKRYIWVILFIAVLSAAVSYFSIKNIITETPSGAIKPQIPKSVTPGLIEKSRVWKKMPFNIRWNYRNTKRNKFKPAITFIGVIGCSILLISGFAVHEQMESSKNWYFDDVNHFESKLIIEDNENTSVADAVSREVNGDEIMESSIELSMNHTQSGSLMILNNTDLISTTDENHNPMKIGDGEVSISKKMAELLDVNAGDTVDFKIAGSNKWIKIKIDKIHASPFNQGLVMSADKLEKIGLNYTPTSIITSQHVNKSYDGIKSILYLNDMKEGWDEMQKTSNLIINTLLFFAIVLAGVILYNMDILTFMEMKHDITILKILGFKTNYLTKLFATQSMIFITAGFLLGIPISYYILTLLMPVFGKKIYLIPSISVSNLIFSFAIILSVSIIMNLYFSRKIKKVDMVNSLKNFK